MGRIYRTNFGKHRFVDKLASRDAREIGAMELKIASRKSLDYYGKQYTSLNKSQKAYMREKARKLMSQGATE